METFTRRWFLLILLFPSIINAACAQDVGDNREYLSFHLVNEPAWEILDHYYTDNPDFSPTQNEDGTFNVPDDLCPPGMMVLATFGKDDSGQERPLRYIVVSKEPQLSGLAVKSASIVPGVDNSVDINFIVSDYKDEAGALQHGSILLWEMQEKYSGSFFVVVYKNKIIGVLKINKHATEGQMTVTTNLNELDAIELINIIFSNPVLNTY